MACWQRVFLRLPAQPTQPRAALLSELATTHITFIELVAGDFVECLQSQSPFHAHTY